MPSIHKRNVKTYKTYRTEWIEVFNLTWNLNNPLPDSTDVSPLSPFQYRRPIKELSFETGHKINLPCSWKFRFFAPILQQGMKILEFDLKLKKTFPQSVSVAYEVLVKLDKDGAKDFKRLAIPKSSIKSVSPVMSVFYDEDWSLESVEIRLEVFNLESLDTTLDSPSKKSLLQNKSKIQTLNNFQNLLHLDGNFSDFKIKMPDGKEFQVHKAILASQSPVFSTMFNSNMTEASSGTMEITDLTTQAMNLILKFIYSGSMGEEEWMDIVQELIYAGEKYELKLLMEFCDTMLVDACKTQNAIELLKTARKFGLHTAEKEIKAWVLHNMTTEQVLNATVFSNAF